MDIRKVKKLIEMLEASNLEEIEIQEGEESVRLVKNKAHGTISSDVEITKEIGVGKENKQETLEEELGDKITSPMVGTFYSAPSPGAKPFISVGDEIQEGDTV
ncbi:MAG: acetyl-CoA carboxylase biotin carboxyl carrier protein, partial [SAR86 cluster bacterium]|nr:acetyl-CoA carboxylase biotin carboxyl carrier protein [SAR86 cluster bacterium]